MSRYLYTFYDEGEAAPIACLPEKDAVGAEAGAFLTGHAHI